MKLGKLGVWTFLDLMKGPEAAAFCQKVEALGYGAIWFPEAVGRDPFVFATHLLDATDTLALATGIVNIYARDAMTTANALRTIEEAHPGRFLLGLGVSHHNLVEWVRKHDYSKPLTTMRQYLERMDASMFKGVAPAEPPSRVLAALGPKMLALSAELADGAHPYFVPVEHTAIAREAIGPEKLLAVEQMIVLESEPDRARDIARKHMGIYLGLPNYANNLLRLGFSEADVTDASDKVVDAIVAWGSVDDAVGRVQAHHDAGADHVCVQVLTEDGGRVPIDEWRLLAEALL